MGPSRHIAILCSYLHVPGGYEKAVITLANLFIEKGHQVTLVILDKTKEIFYPVSPAVKIVQQPLSFGITSDGNVVTRKIKLLSDVLKLRRILKEIQPGFIIATEYPFSAAALLSGAGKKAKLIAWEHHHFATVVKNAFWNFISNRAFQKLDAVVALNEDEKNHYQSQNKNSIVIPNFIEPAKPALPNGENTKTDILTVTRFNHIKGIDLLMSVAKIVLRENPELTWKVIGYGEQEEELRQFILKENLTGRLFLQQATEIDITEEYRQASFFVMTSRNECFPLVLLEAMSNGLPCIAFDCDTGPRHIILHNKTGLVTGKENVTEMATAITTLIKDPTKRKQMSEQALIAVQQFYPEKVYEKWEQLFQQLK
ncbi:MAG: glycosyltransferase family 4 protein [Ferruginibacter sp.]|nr:glycosyltransferase family 4 protein [Chitinophagaceae bacterium]